MITDVRLRNALTESVGLSSCELRNLGPTVVLAGPNGGGKSRYLRLLRKVAKAAGSENELLQKRNEVRMYEQMVAQQGRSGEQYLPNLKEASAQLVVLESMVKAVTLTSAPTGYPMLDVARIGLEIESTRIRMPNPLAEDGGPIERLVAERGKVLERHARALFNAAHPAMKDNIEVQESGTRAKAVGDAVKAILGTDLDYTVVGTDPKAKLFARPYNDAELSAGQHLLLAWTLLLQGEGEHVGPGSLVFIDEPERQLHPRAAIDLLSRLQKLVGPDGQLWIATHSPSIVADFGNASLYCVDKGGLRFAGSRLDEVIDGLLGGPDGRRAMADCLADAEMLNLHRYAVEALFAPDVAGHRERDRQGSQLSDVVQRVLGSSNDKLRILDYASGKARFAVALADELAPDLRARIEYFSFNDRHHDEHRDECVRNIRRLHADDAEGRASVEISDFFDTRRVNLVIMSNFLHEVEPHEWKSHFANAANVLTDDGLLVVMEDQEPPVGELPTQDGFIVLDLTAMRTLFGRKTEVRALSNDARLTALEIPKQLLQNYNGDHLREALLETSNRAKAEIRRLRAGGIAATPQALGRRHAFYALLFASTQLVLDRMPSPAVSHQRASEDTN